MPNTTTPELNRLRAAAGLIPIIESGLQEGKLSAGRAVQMSDFCRWATDYSPATQEEERLKTLVVQGLDRLSVRLHASDDAELANGHVVSA